MRTAKLEPLSAQNSASKGTCHVALDHSGRVLVSADYGGGSAASFQVTEGKLSRWCGPSTTRCMGRTRTGRKRRMRTSASFSPDNRFAYINDLGGDMIHIYRLDAETAKLTPAGAYHAKPGSGPRTLHFHPNGHTAYCMNEMSFVGRRAGVEQGGRQPDL